MNVVNIGAMENWVPVDGVTHDDVEVTGTVTTLGTLNAKTRRVLLTVEDAAVRMTFDGSAPTAEHGHRFATGTVLGISRAMALRAKVVRATSTNGKLTVTECMFANGA